MSHRKRKYRQKLPPGKFITIPVDVLKRALGELTAPEFRVFVVICAQSHPWSNGTAKLTRSVMAEHHLGSARVVSSATGKLLAGGFMRRTRAARQHRCALYAVAHMPLNLDALAKEGVSATTWEALPDDSSATNRGSAAALPHGKRYRYHMGSAEHESTPPALPHGNRTGRFSAISALPHGNTSKNLPSPTPKLNDAEGGRK